MSEQKKLIGQADEKQIAEWKKKYPEAVWVKHEGHVGYFKRPDFHEIDCYHSKAKEAKNISDVWKEIAGLLFIGGSEAMRDDVRHLPRVSKRLEELMFGEEAELGNL